MGCSNAPSLLAQSSLLSPSVLFGKAVFSSSNPMQSPRPLRPSSVLSTALGHCFRAPKCHARHAGTICGWAGLWAEQESSRGGSIRCACGRRRPAASDHPKRYNRRCPFPLFRRVPSSGKVFAIPPKMRVFPNPPDSFGEARSSTAEKGALSIEDAKEQSGDGEAKGVIGPRRVKVAMKKTIKSSWLSNGCDEACACG